MCFIYIARDVSICRWTGDAKSNILLSQEYKIQYFCNTYRKLDKLILLNVKFQGRDQIYSIG